MKAVTIAAMLALAGSVAAQNHPLVIRPEHVDHRLILLQPKKYIGKKLVIRGKFESRDTEKESLTIGQGVESIDVFYRDLPKDRKAEILSTETGASVQVTAGGTLLRYTNRQNTFYIMADLVRFGQLPSSLFVDEIAMDAPWYRGKMLQLKGAADRVNPARKSFMLAQDYQSIEVVYSKMPPERLGVLSKLTTPTPVTVRGTLQEISQPASYVAPAPYQGKRLAILAWDVVTD